MIIRRVGYDFGDLLFYHLMDSASLFWLWRAVFCAIYALTGSQHTKPTLYLTSGSVPIGGGHGAKRKWDFLIRLLAWQGIFVGKTLHLLRQFLPLH